VLATWLFRAQPDLALCVHRRPTHRPGITLVILKITWDSWRTVMTTEPGELVELREH
jgi:hypothetical protein